MTTSNTPEPTLADKLADFLEELWTQTYDRVRAMLEQNDPKAPCTFAQLDEFDRVKRRAFQTLREGFSSTDTFSKLVYLGMLSGKLLENTAGMAMEILTKPETAELLVKVEQDLAAEELRNAGSGEEKS
jgi:hypothetical protein